MLCSFLGALGCGRCVWVRMLGNLHTQQACLGSRLFSHLSICLFSVSVRHLNHYVLIAYFSAWSEDTGNLDV